MLAGVAACSGSDSTSPDLAALPITAAQVDSAYARLAPVFEDTVLAALGIGTAPRALLRDPFAEVRDPLMLGASPVDSVFVPTAIRGRRFAVGPAERWEGIPDATVPPNGLVMMLYRSFPVPALVAGPPVGSLTIVDSSAFPTAVGVITARTLSGRVVLRARITRLPDGNVVSFATFGGASATSATLVETSDATGLVTRTQVGLVGSTVAVYSARRADIGEVGLILGGDTLAARRSFASAQRDSTSFAINGRFIGSSTTPVSATAAGGASPVDHIAAAATVDGRAVIAAAMRLFDAVAFVPLRPTIEHAVDWARRPR